MNLSFEENEARWNNTALFTSGNTQQCTVTILYNSPDFAKANSTKRNFNKSSKQAGKDWLAFYKKNFNN